MNPPEKLVEALESRTLMSVSSPLVDVKVLASASPKGPFTSSLTVTTGETVYFEVEAQLAPVGTVNGVGKKVLKITELSKTLDGIFTLGFNLLDASSNGVKVKFGTEALSAGWHDFVGSDPGTPTNVGGVDNELASVFAVRAPGSAAGALSPTILETGSFKVSAAPHANKSAITGSFSLAGGFRVNDGKNTKLISPQTQASAYPLVAFTSLILSGK